MRNIFFTFMVLGLVLCGQSWASDVIRVFAATSLANAVDAIIEEYEGTIRVNYAGTNTLALQIREGASCDIFLSAHPVYVKELLLKEQRDFLFNRLVVIGRFDQQEISDLGELIKTKERIALADPDLVPAGIYARQVLSRFGVWESVQNQIVPTVDVRGALAYVEQGHVPYAIVYATDIKISDKVKSLYVIPKNYHEQIIYSFALLKGSSREAQNFFNFLLSKQAKDIFQQHGFEINDE